MKLGAVLRKYRMWSEISVREFSKELKISSATLSRIENGGAMDGVTLAKILNWLMAL